MKENQKIIEDLASAIENMINAKISISQGNDHPLTYSELYQSRADIKESLAILLGVEIN